MIGEIPYFMENEDWYIMTNEGIQLTSNATEKAIESYNEWVIERKKILDDMLT